MLGRSCQPRVLVDFRRLSTTRRACAATTTCGRLDSDRNVRVWRFVFHLARSHVMESVPGADRDPRAGSPRGVVDATGSQLIARIEFARMFTRSLPLPVLTSSSQRVTSNHFLNLR